MKKRWQELTKVQKGTLLVLAVLTVVFAVVYLINVPKLGMSYNGSFFLLTENGPERTYTGHTEGADAVFTAQGDTIASTWGEEHHVYTVKTDVTAVPQEWRGSSVQGVEVWEGDKRLFRGGWDTHYELLYREDGELESLMTIRTNFDPPMREPTVALVLSLWSGPELVHRADGFFYFLGLVVAVLGALGLLFADELFRWHMAWQIRNPYGAEPSDWELLGRTIGGIVMTLGALFIWGAGLSVH